MPRIKMNVRVQQIDTGRVGTVVGKFLTPGVKYPWYVRWDDTDYPEHPDGDITSNASGPYATSELSLHESDEGSKR
jgi:hypothetical protein